MLRNIVGTLLNPKIRSMATDTQQTGLKRDEKGRIIGGTPPAGFNKHPENISPGGWNKEESISYQYNRLMRMEPAELDAFKPQTVAQEIAVARVKQARKDTGLLDTKEITDRTEGKAPQSIDVTSGGDKLGATITFADHPKADDSSTDVS